MGANVVLRSKGAEVFKISLPNGKEKSFTFEPNGDGFICEVPTVIKYRDDFGKEKIARENFAQDLLNGYPHLEIVSVDKEEEVVQPAVTKPKKGKKHEEIS